ncbi:GumC family protein [Rhodobacteraceae bacterium B1Z28]|uniref:GumC family protein n=1 Tax=Ruegeria haliotis TaxID=2747601 RepID=A0ABX2PU61_9RHOB|nr:GumC family protein [Ruegeria haliotis]NVO57329.1 GumC family protein [Ruegeria haliotis]
MNEPVKERRITWTKDNAHLLAGYRDEPRLDMGAMIRAVRRQAPLVMTCAIAGVVIAILMILGSVPRYTAVETVLLDEERAELLDEVSPLPNAVRSDTAVQSEIEIIKSRALAYQVVDLLKLDQDADFLSPPLGVTEKLNRMVSSVTRPIAQLLTPDPPVRENSGPTESDETGAAGSQIPIFNLEVTDRDRAVRILRDRLSVSRSGQSLVIEIGFSDFDPTRAALVARGYGAAYESFQLLTTNEVAAKAEAWLRERLEVLEQKSIQATSALQEFRTENDLVQVRGDLLTEQQQSELATELVNAAASSAEAEAYLSSLESLLARANGNEDIIAVPFVEGLVAGVSDELRREYLNAGQSYRRIVEQFGETHPQAQLLDERIQELADTLLVELEQATEAARIAYNIARGRERSLRADLEATTGTTDLNVALRGRLQQLEAISETYAQVYRDYLARLEVTMQQQNFPIASVKIISPAEIPKDPSSPRKKAMLFIGLLLGGLLGTLAGTARELIPKPVRTVSELRQEVGLSCAGMLPNAGSLGNSGAIDTYTQTIERLAQACEANALKSDGLLIAIAPLTQGLKRTYDLPLELANRLSRNGTLRVLVVFEHSPPQALPATALADIETVSLQDALGGVQASAAAGSVDSDQTVLTKELRANFSFVLLVMDPLSQSEQSDPHAWAYDMTLLRIPWGKVLPSFVSDALLDHPRFSEALTTTVLEDADLGKARRYLSTGSYEELKING